MVSEPEKARRRAKLAELAAGIRADLTEIRIADRLSKARLLPATGKTFAEDLQDHEKDWDSENAPTNRS